MAESGSRLPAVHGASHVPTRSLWKALSIQPVQGMHGNSDHLVHRSLAVAEGLRLDAETLRHGQVQVAQRHLLPRLLEKPYVRLVPAAAASHQDGQLAIGMRT